MRTRILEHELTAFFALQDFLVRGLIGFDQSTGAMAVGEGVRVGQRLRFMVRDRDGAMRDLTDHGLALKRRQLQVHACCLSRCMAEGAEMRRVPAASLGRAVAFRSTPAAGTQLSTLCTCALETLTAAGCGHWQS